MKDDILSLDPAYWRSELVGQEFNEEDMSEFLRDCRSALKFETINGDAP